MDINKRNLHKKNKRKIPIIILFRSITTELAISKDDKEKTLTNFGKISILINRYEKNWKRKLIIKNKIVMRMTTSWIISRREGFNTLDL
ncbi:MAG: hypothetical protein AB3K77_03210 [Methanosarcinaceae archaeon]